MVDPTEGIVEAVDEEEDLVKFKFEKMDEQDDIQTAYVKLYNVSEKYEKLYRLTTKHEKLYRLATKKRCGAKLRRALYQGWWSQSNHWSTEI